MIPSLLLASVDTKTFLLSQNTCKLFFSRSSEVFLLLLLLLLFRRSLSNLNKEIMSWKRNYGCHRGHFSKFPYLISTPSFWTWPNKDNVSDLESCRISLQQIFRLSSWAKTLLVQSLNSPFFPPHIGAEPGRAKEESRESRITCMCMLRANQSSPNHAAHVNVSRNAFFSSRSERIKNWFMLSVRILSYGCTWEVGEHERSVRVARGDSREQL